MKRTLLLAVVLATPLYLRQREVEKRQRLWQRAVEVEVGRHLGASASDARRFGEEVNEALEEAARSWRGWADRLVKEIERAGSP